MPPKEGERAPDLHLESRDGPVTLAEALREGPLVLLFFQEASTPLCDAELRGFAADHDLLRELGAHVLAVSTDPRAARDRFSEQIQAPFAIAGDPDGATARAYGVYDEGSKRANRAVFVIGEDGTITLARPWYNPQNSAQFQQVFAALGLDI
jgi:peroxiredoxin